MGLFSWFWKPKIQETETKVAEKSAKKEENDRVRELLEARIHVLREYEHRTKKKQYTKDDNCVIYLKHGITNVYEILEVYDLDASKCVVVVPPPEDIDTEILCPKKIAGVFDPHEKARQIIFPDGISADTVLFNVKAVDTEMNNISSIANTDLFNFFDLDKVSLLKLIFGREQRLRSKSIEKYILSLDVVNQDSVFFHMVFRASKKVKNKIFDFKQEYFSLKEKCLVESRVYPSVPDEVFGGSFDWVKAEREAKEGVMVKHFHGKLFFDKLAENNDELKFVIDMEKSKIDFLNQFPGLEEAIDEGGMRANSHYKLGRYSYVAYDRARYDHFTDFKTRGLNRRHCVWDSLLYELEQFYTEGTPRKRCSSYNKKEEKKTKIVNDIFSQITTEMLTGKLSDDEELISFVNLNSSDNIVSQLDRNTTYTYMKLPTIDSQNDELRGRMYRVAIEQFENALQKELKSGFIKSDRYSTIKKRG